jgi:hypothetical protein
MPHLHFCDIGYGHNWECDGKALRPEAGDIEPRLCVCISCQVPMEQGDHSDCPIELVACPEHREQQQRTMQSERTLADFDFAAKCKRAEDMPDGQDRDALLREIVESIFPGNDKGGNH